MKKLKLPVKGMTCAHCSRSVEDVLEKAGVSARVNLSQSTVTFSYDETKLSLVYLQRLIKKAGYNLILPDGKKLIPWGNIRLVVALITLILSLIGMIHHLGIHNDFFMFFDAPIFRMITAAIALVFLGLQFNIRAIKSIKNRALGMDFLISVSTLIAFGLSLYTFIVGSSTTYFETTTMILAIITIGDRITYSLKKETGSSTLTVLKNDGQLVTLLYPNGKYKEVDIDSVEEDDILLVRKGEVVGADGVILSGVASLDEKILTGESRPRSAKTGELVYYGTSNLGEEFTLKVLKPAIKSIYTDVILESYALDRSGGKLNKISDFIASIFVPIVFTIFIIGFLINYFGMHNDMESSLINSVSILVVSCPCAFGLAVPLSSLNGYNLAIKNGIMFKNGSTFETIKKVNEFYFDKTGTLTTGDLKVTYSHYASEEAKKIIKSLELHSLHPIARGILSELSEVEELPLSGVEEKEGQGFSYRNYRLGRYEFVGSPKLSGHFLSEALGTRVYLTNNGILEAVIVLEDEIAPGAKETIALLKTRGIKTYMLTGDNKSFAEIVGKKLGFADDEVFAELSPNGKIEVIKSHRLSTSITAYCGDGVNDLLALSLVDLSVASYKATGAAKGKADVLLLKDDLQLLGTTISLSRHVYINIIENFIWALLYNASMIPLALIGNLDPSLAAVLMIVSNLTLILNSWRIKLWKGGKNEINS